MASSSTFSDAEAHIQRLLQCQTRHLSPFEVFQIPPEAIPSVTTEEITKMYRRLTLLLHPDKCAHPQAAEAFHVAQKSYSQLRIPAVLHQLQRAEERRRQEQQADASRNSGGKRARRDGDVARSAGPPLGQRCRLNASGISTSEEKAAEIARVLQCAADDYFNILDIHPDEKFGASVPGGANASTVGELVSKRYRRAAQALHPDKCDLPRAAEAFTRLEKARHELQDPQKFIHHKALFRDQQQQSAGVRRGTGSSGDWSRLSAEERLAEAVREQVLEATRLAEETAAKKRKLEAERVAMTKLEMDLEEERNEWENLNLF